MKDKTKQILAFIVIDTLMPFAILFYGIYHIILSSAFNVVIPIICLIIFITLRTFYHIKLRDKWCVLK